MTEVQTLKTGTTTLGIIAKDSVIIAAEQKATMGYLIESKQAQKIHKLADNIGLTIVGGATTTGTPRCASRAGTARSPGASFRSTGLTDVAGVALTPTTTLQRNAAQSTKPKRWRCGWKRWIGRLCLHFTGLSATSAASTWT